MKDLINSTDPDLIEYHTAALTPLSCRSGAGGEVL